jgi:hypothetical protein
MAHRCARRRNPFSAPSQRDEKNVTALVVDAWATSCVEKLRL